MDAASVLKTSARHGTVQSAKRRNHIPGWISWGAAAATAALLVIAFGVGGTSLPGMQPAGTQSARAAEPLITKRGEIRTYRLSDGSHATLDTDSRLDVLMDRDGRRVRLVHGRVRLSIDTDERPFRIEAGQQLLTAQAAELDVDLDGAGVVTVALRSGEADLRRPGATGPSAVLQPDETMRYRGDGSPQLATAPTGPAAREWPSGWAEYQSIRLADLVAEANRYSAVPIEIDDPATAALSVSGRFHISRTEPFIGRIAELFGLVVERKPGAIHLRRK